VNSEVENIGARRLHTILSNLLEEILFQVPDQNTATTFRITPDQVRERVGRLAQRKEMSEYIL
jgi:ATP-dependent HslUV protease ATP-binding subunit HslU